MGKLERTLEVARQQIAAREQVEATLRESEKRFRALSENSVDAIALIDAQGLVLYHSPPYSRIMGYAREERRGKNTFEHVHPEDRENLLRLLAGLVTKPERIAFPPTRVQHRDGTWRWIEGVANNLLAEPAVHAIVINFRDITENKSAVDALHQRNAELTTLNHIGQALGKLAEPAAILELVFTQIGQVLDNRNLFIALYDPAARFITFPVYTMNGQRYTVKGRPLGNGITDHIIRTQTPIFICADLANELARRGIDLIGAVSCSFLGVPMRAGDQVIGVIAIQDYERANA